MNRLVCRELIWCVCGILLQAKSGKELVGFLFNDFMLLTIPQRSLGNVTSVFSLDSNNFNMQFKMYRMVSNVACTDVPQWAQIYFLGIFLWLHGSAYVLEALQSCTKPSIISLTLRMQKIQRFVSLLPTNLNYIFWHKLISLSSLPLPQMDFVLKRLTYLILTLFWEWQQMVNVIRILLFVEKLYSMQMNLIWCLIH